jgi:Ala-tRNA(Pro) deacylase
MDQSPPLSPSLVRGRIEALLDGVPHERLVHPPTRSATEAAEVRGTPLAIGGKSLLFKLGKRDFAMLVVSGAKRTSNRAIRHALGIQRLRFARPEELLARTGLTPGCVPPFGRPVFDVPLYVDAGTAAQARIAFSLASHEESVVMRTEDWLRIARPERIFPFS